MSMRHAHGNEEERRGSEEEEGGVVCLGSLPSLDVPPLQMTSCGEEEEEPSVPDPQPTYLPFSGSSE